MASAAQSLQTSDTTKSMLWSGRILSALVVAFLLFDASVKLFRLPAAVEGTARIGYSASVLVPLGIVLLTSTLLYAMPRTAGLGAILLTGYLGGATASQVRIGDPWFFFPVVFGVLAWTGLFLRDERLRKLVPFRR